MRASGSYSARVYVNRTLWFVCEFNRTTTKSLLGKRCVLLICIFFTQRMWHNFGLTPSDEICFKIDVIRLSLYWTTHIGAILSSLEFMNHARSTAKSNRTRDRQKLIVAPTSLSICRVPTPWWEIILKIRFSDADRHLSDAALFRRL